MLAIQDERDRPFRHYAVAIGMSKVAQRGFTIGRDTHGAGELFACRRCYGLAYASQQETPMRRGVNQAQKIRMRLGGSVNLFAPFPEKPERMHWRTYLRLRARAEAAEHYSNGLTMQWLNRLKRRRKLA
jgi:hypothetical protein